MKFCSEPNCINQVFTHGFCKNHAGKYYVEKYGNKMDRNYSIQQLVRELDKWFSLFIRLRHADKDGMVKDFTRGTTLHYTDAHCGHWISRRHYATRWDEKNCQVQTVAQNIFNQGDAPAFGERLNEVYGAETTKLLLMKKNNKFKLEKVILQALISEYKQKVEQLKIQKGIII